MSVAAPLSCSKTDTDSPATVPDASALPDASTPALDATASETSAADAADISLDEPSDTEHDARVEPPMETSDVIGEVETDTTDDAVDAASDLSDDGTSDAVMDAVVDRSDAIVSADANPCGDGSAAVPRRIAPSAPSGQLECTANKPCPPMYECLGGGCDDVWECIYHGANPGEHPCPTEPADYCGCDGVTFTAVLSCPNRPYQRTGACEDGFSCDPMMLRCNTPEPPCPEGQVPSVVDGRYGQCVPIRFCRCQFVWECPHREKYKCDTVATRCTTLPVDP